MSATAPPRLLYVSWSLPAVESRAPQGSNAGRWDLAPMPWPSLTIHPPGSDAQRRPPQIRHPGQRPAPHPSISSPRLSSGDPRADPAAAARPVPGRLPARLTAFVGPGRRPHGRPRSRRDRASGGRGGDACAVAPVPWLSPLAGSLRHGAAFQLKNRTTSPPDRQTLRKSWPCAEEEAGRLLSPGAAASTWAGSAPRAGPRPEPPPRVPAGRLGPSLGPGTSSQGGRAPLGPVVRGPRQANDLCPAPPGLPLGMSLERGIPLPSPSV